MAIVKSAEWQLYAASGREAIILLRSSTFARYLSWIVGIFIPKKSPEAKNLTISFKNANFRTFFSISNHVQRNFLGCPNSKNNGDVARRDLGICSAPPPPSKKTSKCPDFFAKIRGKILSVFSRKYAKQSPAARLLMLKLWIIAFLNGKFENFSALQEWKEQILENF